MKNQFITKKKTLKKYLFKSFLWSIVNNARPYFPSLERLLKSKCFSFSFKISSIVLFSGIVQENKNESVSLIHKLKSGNVGTIKS